MVHIHAKTGFHVVLDSKKEKVVVVVLTYVDPTYKNSQQTYYPTEHEMSLGVDTWSIEA